MFDNILELSLQVEVFHLESSDFREAIGEGSDACWQCLWRDSINAEGLLLTELLDSLHLDYCLGAVLLLDTQRLVFIRAEGLGHLVLHHSLSDGELGWGR